MKAEFLALVAAAEANTPPAAPGEMTATEPTATGSTATQPGAGPMEPSTSAMAA